METSSPVLSSIARFFLEKLWKTLAEFFSQAFLLFLRHLYRVFQRFAFQFLYVGTRHFPQDLFHFFICQMQRIHLRPLSSPSHYRENP